MPYHNIFALQSHDWRGGDSSSNREGLIAKARQFTCKWFVQRNTKIFISQERERGIIVVNIVPNVRRPKTPIQNTMRQRKNGDPVASLLHLVRLAVIFGLFLQSSAFSDFLLLALTLDFLCDKIFVRLQTALDVNLKFDNVVEHALELRVEFFAHG
jgi:hypothetical protein